MSDFRMVDVRDALDHVDKLVTAATLIARGAQFGLNSAECNSLAALLSTVDLAIDDVRGHLGNLEKARPEVLVDTGCAVASPDLDAVWDQCAGTCNLVEGAVSLSTVLDLALTHHEDGLAPLELAAIASTASLVATGIRDASERAAAMMSALDRLKQAA